MTYEIQIERKALKFISRQPPEQRKRILSAIYRLPNEGDRRSLEGRAGYFRLRVGNYRVIYTVENGRFLVRVVDAGNRGQIYKWRQ